MHESAWADGNTQIYGVLINNLLSSRTINGRVAAERYLQRGLHGKWCGGVTLRGRSIPGLWGGPEMVFQKCVEKNRKGGVK